MTEMTDLTSDLLGSGIPFLDYKLYAERVFFPGHQESPLHRDLGVPESRRPTVEQGLGQLSNLLNSKLFLTKVQPRPRPRPRPRPTPGFWPCPAPSSWPPPIPPRPLFPSQLLNHLFLPPVPLSLCPSPAPVHPHSGEPAHLLRPGPRLRGLSAHRGSAWEARVLHRHPAHPAQ